MKFMVGLKIIEIKNITIDAGNSGTLARLICGLLSNYNYKVKLLR